MRWLARLLGGPFLARRHYHAYEAVSADVMSGTGTTLVVMRCSRCAESESVLLNGSWTVEQIGRLHSGKDGKLRLEYNPD